MSQDRTTHNVFARLDSETFKKFKVACAQEGRSIKWTIAKLVDLYLQNKVKL